MGGEREQKPERDPRDWNTKTLRWERHQFDRIIEVLESFKSEGSDLAVLTAIGQLTERMEELMGTQEERLRVISTQVSEVKTLLADLKANNPDIEDEIAEIEAKLATAPVEPPVEPVP